MVRQRVRLAALDYGNCWRTVVANKRRFDPDVSLRKGAGIFADTASGPDRADLDVATM